MRRVGLKRGLQFGNALFCVGSFVSSRNEFGLKLCRALEALAQSPVRFREAVLPVSGLLIDPELRREVRFLRSQSLNLALGCVELGCQLVDTRSGIERRLFGP